MIKEELYELILQDEEDGVFATSFVDSPAIERDFVFFGKEINFQAVSEEKKLVAGPLLIPNKKILRLDGEGRPYYVFFTPETIEKIARKFMKNKYNDAVTVEHERKVGGIHLTESWLIEQSAKDKSNIYGFTLPKGTWFGVYDVSGNPKVWQDVKDGKFNGFSIEGLFEHKKSNLKLSIAEKSIDDLTEEEATIVLSQIKALIKKDKRYKSKQKVEMESYSDYGDGVKNNAKRALEWADKNGWGSCGTPVGKLRANQLAKGEPISIDTIKRMYSFLSRHEGDLETSTAYGDGCGKLMYDAWGGKAALGWSRNKLRELGEIELAEVGPRGGIKESPKAPKSDTKNPNPKGEGTAKGDASGKRGAKVTAEQEKTLQNKVDEFNERESNTKNGRATLGALKSVFQRGLGAFNVSHSPRVQSAEQWAYARVNAFLYLIKNGRPENPKYDSDFDLLPKGHPKADTKLEAQPSVVSSYPGEAASGSISPALLAEDCPEATQSIPVNLENRQKAIDQANYGPLNPNEPNGVYWKKKADMFKGDVESAKKALCGNCAFFLQTQKILDCIAEGIGGDVKDEWDTIEAGNLGYCEAFDFKCAANRTCDAWVVGGPITD